MGKVIQKLETFNRALDTLQISVSLYEEYQEMQLSTIKHEQLILALRDSMIQRFEYCTDLLWKMLKFYLEEIKGVSILIHSPAAIIREAVQANILNEEEGEECIVMIKKRDETSHIYHQNTGEILQNMSLISYLL